MEVFYVYIIPMLLVLSMTIWMRTSVRYGEDEIKLPRLFMFVFMICAFMPFVNIAVLIILIVYHFISITTEEHTLVENKFNKYLFQS